MSAAITPDQLDNAFASLNSETRAEVLSQMMKAINDTCMEYHKVHDRETQVKLYTEIQGLQVCRDSLVRVHREYDDITNKDHNSNDGKEQSDDSDSSWRNTP